MSANPREIADGVMFLRTMVVNVYFVREGRSWVLIDAGLRGYAGAIRRAAQGFAGPWRPSAIVLTHGHFDHVGALPELLDDWRVPVYAHRLERPYLTGRSKYPPSDPLVGRGALALVSRLYPRGPIDIQSSLELLSDPESVPNLPGWRWIHTPGHTAGHISLFRDRDRTLIAGDAVTTVQQESVLAVATQRRELHGPPAYFTQDWRAAGESVGRLAALRPEVLGSGHGQPVRGEPMRAALRNLASRFERDEVPSFGRYAGHPAITDERGIVRLPPDPLPKIVAGIAVAGALAYGIAHQRRTQRR